MSSHNLKFYTQLHFGNFNLLIFFHYFLELILGLTIENIFIAHTYYIVNDII